jgi:hypothetical protein
MKKLLGLLVVGLLLSGNAYAEIIQIEKGKIRFLGGYDASGVTSFCVDGYKFVAVRAPEAISVTQAFEIRGDQSLPAVCPGIL